MSGVFNTIQIGFAWEQELTLAEGMIAAGDGLRADFRYAVDDDDPLFAIASAGNGIVIEGLSVTLSLTPQRTAAIAPPEAGKEWRTVLCDLVRLPEGGGEEHLGFRLHIPAALPVTRASA